MRIIKIITVILFLIFRLTGFADTTNSRNIKSIEIQASDTLEIEYYKSLTDSFPFENYKVKKFYSGKIAKLDLSAYKELPKDIIVNVQSQYDDQKQPNFAGQYIIISWDCGSPCQENAIIDAKSGKTIRFVNSGIGICFQVESYLLIVNPPSDIKFDKSFRELIGPPKYKILKNHELNDLN